MKFRLSRTEKGIILPETDKIASDKNLAIVIKILLKNYAKIIYSLLTNGYKDVIIFRW